MPKLRIPLPRVQTVVQVWRCPVHGLIESPRWFGQYEDEKGYYCPINLSSDERGITDDLCDQPCSGPFRALID